MKTTVGRITTRLCTPNDGLMIGVVIKGEIGHFKPNGVYELRHCSISNNITMEYVGESMIGSKNVQSDINWGHAINDIVIDGSHIWLTDDEYNSTYPNNELL